MSSIRMLALFVMMITALQVTGCATSNPYYPVPSKPAASYRFESLSQLTDTFAMQLSTNIKLSDLFMDRTAVRDIITGDVSNFSAYLQNELESSLSQKGFGMVYDPADAQYLIGATYQKHRADVRIFIKYHNTDLSGLKSFDYDIARSRLPADSFAEDLKSKAYKLAVPVLKGYQKLKVYMTPIREGRGKYVSAFSESFTARVKIQLKQLYPQARIMDERPLVHLPSIQKKAAAVKNVQHSEAALVNADAVLEGEYFVEGRAVSVHLFLKRLDGLLLSSSTVDIPRAMIAASLSDATSQKLVHLLDRPSERPSARVSLFTTKGGHHPVYYDGENITFMVQVSEPLYVYIYNINVLGEVALLYPYESHAREQRFRPGRVYTLPPEHDQQAGTVYEFQVEPPFGKDAVKLFACRKPVPLPILTSEVQTLSFREGQRISNAERKGMRSVIASRSQIHPLDIVDYYRGQALRLKEPVLEDSLIIETRSP
jgi:hypothetical protein